MALTPSTILGRNTIHFYVLIANLVSPCIGCDEGTELAGQYQHSKGHVIDVPVQPTDERISLTPFVRLKDGTVELPMLFYLHKHHTSVGVRDVEKRGQMSVVAAPYRKSIKLPTSSEIEEYLFLAGGPSLVQGEEAGKETVVTKWTPSGLLRVLAKDIEPGKPLRVPPLADLEIQAKAEEKLFDRLCKNLELARREAEERGKVPVGPNTVVPWWGK